MNDRYYYLTPLASVGAAPIGAAPGEDFRVSDKGFVLVKYRCPPGRPDELPPQVLGLLAAGKLLTEEGALALVATWA